MDPSQSKLAIVISDPIASTIENQIVECLKISPNIIISFCDSNLVDVIAEMIEKYQLDDYVNMVQYEKTEEIEFNPLIENENPTNAFWNNISRINGVNFVISEELNVKWILFLNYNEAPNDDFSAFYVNLSSENCSYIFREIILMPCEMFSNDLNIVKILMSETERLGSAKCINYHEIQEPVFDIVGI